MVSEVLHTEFGIRRHSGGWKKKIRVFGLKGKKGI